MQRNNNIDTLRLVCAAEVVFAHVPFIKFGVVDPHFAVPCFLMISGYFVYSPDKEKMSARLVKGMKSIAWIAAWSTAVYLLYSCFYPLPKSEMAFTWQGIAALLLLNVTIFGNHLWYLFAYLYVLLIAYALHRKGWLAVLTWATPFLLLSLVLCGKYSSLITDKEISLYLTRNFFAMGIPFFTLGMLLRKKLIAPHIAVPPRRTMVAIPDSSERTAMYSGEVSAPALWHDERRCHIPQFSSSLFVPLPLGGAAPHSASALVRHDRARGLAIHIRVPHVSVGSLVGSHQ